MNRLIRLFAAVVPVVAMAQEKTAPAPTSAPAPTITTEQVLQPPPPGRFKQLFQPFRTEVAALSPDGKYLAYSVREGDVVSVVVIDLAQPDRIKTRVQVIDANAATPMLAANQMEKTPGRINWMGWTTPNRLVVETNHVFSRTAGHGGVWNSWRGAVVGFDADGANARRILSPDDLPEFSAITTRDDPFSTVRRNSAGFNSRVLSMDQPLAEQGTNNASMPTIDQIPSLQDSDPGLQTTTPPNFGARQPRTLRIFDFDPRHPGSITVVATGVPRSEGSHSLGLYSLDTQTGKLTEQTDDLVLNTRTALLDRQGHVRLTLSNTLLSSFPLHYDYLGTKGQNRPKPFEATIGLSGFSVSPDNYFGERSIPLGFDENPDVIYYASNTGRDTYGIYSFNLAEKKRGSLVMENPAYDLIGPPTAGFPDQRDLVFDRYQHKLVGIRYENALRTTAWLRPEFQAMQAQFEKMFPGRSIEITDWDEAEKHFIVTTEGPADAGAFFIFDKEKNKLLEFVRRAPWVDANHIHLTLPFSYSTKDGARISGLVTVPQQPRLKPIPMVVLCPDFPWQRVHTDFQSDVQALADMGFVVVQLNGRGAWGLGLKQRQSLTNGYDLVQIDDIVTTVESLEKIFAVNSHRVALMGRGHGGFIALRALQTYPDKFRCAIAIDAPVNLADWLAEQKWTDDDVQPHLTRAWLGDKDRLKAAPLTSHPESVTKPVLMLNYPGLDGAPRTSAYVGARRFAEKVRGHGDIVEFDDLQMDYIQGLPAARAAVFDQIEEFLNTHVYDFNVKVRDLKIIK